VTGAGIASVRKVLSVRYTPRRGRAYSFGVPALRSFSISWVCASALTVATAAGCGAKTGLITPDVPPGPDVVDVFDAAVAMDVPAAQPAIDPACPGTCPYSGLVPEFPPFRPLLPPDVPASCANGFELGGANGGCGGSTYTLHALRPGGAAAITLDVDWATYLAPDGVTVTGLDATGQRYTLLRTCRMQTALVGGPSTMRPPDDTIRQFRLPVRAGTTQLDFDFGAVTTPMYIRVLGLCDFRVTPFTHAAWWQPVP
jgi:hypothetical protein